MRGILCTAIALLILMTACSEPIQISEPATIPGYAVDHGVYELTFRVEEPFGFSTDDWEIVYFLDSEIISRGHQILLPVGVFSFRSILVEFTEKKMPDNTYRNTFPIAVCDGGSGETEVNVIYNDGREAVFTITCDVVQVETRSIDISRPAASAAG